MQGMIRCGLLAGLLVACHTSDPGTPDGNPDGSSPGGPGLHVRWSSEPATYPGNLEDWLTLDSVQLTVEDLKVIGDAGPGDIRTTKAVFLLRWDAQSVPEPIDFEDAPSGLYSKVSMQLDGHLIVPSLEIRGHVDIDGTWLEYEVEDRNAVSLSLDIDRMLDPGGSATVALMLKLHDALTSIDYKSLTVDHGKVSVETGDSQLATFIDKFSRAFSVDNSGPH
jgi:hypothetical protein